MGYNKMPCDSEALPAFTAPPDNGLTYFHTYKYQFTSSSFFQIFPVLSEHVFPFSSMPFLPFCHIVRVALAIHISEKRETICFEVKFNRIKKECH